MRTAFTILVLTIPLAWASPRAAGADRIVNFAGPHSIANVSRPVTVHEGDLNGDGKLELISSNGSGTITILFQHPSIRTDWTPVLLRVGTSTFFTRAGDFDGDRFDDLAAADSSTAFFIRSRGDTTFETPVPLRQARGARWIATGDWNKDGKLDVASSNLTTSTLTIFLGDGAGGFTLTQNPSSGREHTLEALDYDADGLPDLSLGTGIPGIQLHKGLGDGKFMYKGNVSNLGCVEYISTGDFNNDMKGDLAPTCIDDATAYVGVSQGNGRYTVALRVPFAPGTESSAIGDLDGDGTDDVAMVSHGAGLLKVWRSKGDGTFQDPVDFGPTGSMPVFLIAADLDRDDHVDVISADSVSSTLTVFFGRGGERFLESADSITGFGNAKSFAIQDFDRDGFPDIFLASATQPKTFIYLKPGGSSPTRPSLTVDTLNKFGSLAVVDLNKDGVLDLAGANPTTNMAIVALLDATGALREEATLPCGLLPQELKTGFLDAGDTVDLALPCSGSNDISLFFGLGDGKFSEVRSLVTLERPRRVHVSDIDGDGRTDLLVRADKMVAIHYGNGDGVFDGPSILVGDLAKMFTDAVTARMNGDAFLDILVSDSRTQSVSIYLGKGNREFDVPIELKMGVAPVLIQPVDVNGDGLLDITTSSTTSQAVAIALNGGAAGFGPPAAYRVGAAISSHRLVDLNGDQVVDLVGFGSQSVTIRLGRLEEAPAPPGFRRGDTDSNGRIEINDAVTLLNWLFRGGAALVCPDAGDTDDDGLLNLTDAVLTLRWLFLEGRPPAPPGPESCGQDVGVDTLPPCRSRC